MRENILIELLKLNLLSYDLYNLALESKIDLYSAYQKAAQRIYSVSKIAGKVIAHKVGLGPYMDYFYMGVDTVIDKFGYGKSWDEITRNRLKDLIVKKFLETKLTTGDFAGRTIREVLENRIGKLTYPMVQKIIQDENQRIVMKLVKETGVELTKYIGENAADFIQKVVDEWGRKQIPQ